MQIEKSPIVTTAGEEFTIRDSHVLAKLILKRFGNDIGSATLAWRRLLQNNCSEADFKRLSVRIQ